MVFLGEIRMSGKILVVDDDEILRDALVESLKGDGYDVESTDDGKIAMEMLEDEEFGLAIVDLMMPQMSGMELLDRIKKANVLLPVIMITAFATIDTAVEAVKKGATDYISKPFKSHEVEIAVKRALEESKFREKLLSLEGVGDIDDILSSLNNYLRREIILFMNKDESFSFMEILKNVSVEDPAKLNFHLKKLKDANLVDQGAKKRYSLNSRGREAVRMLMRLS